MAAPRKDNVKEKIINATVKLLAKKSLPDISLAEISKIAGISKGTLYYYYKTKSDILFDITDTYLEKQWQELNEWTADSEKDTSLHRLANYVMERNVVSSEMRMHLLHEAMMGNEILREKLLDRYEQFQSIISEKIEERSNKIDSDFFTWLILLASDGLIVQKILHNDNLKSENFLSQFSEYIKTME